MVSRSEMSRASKGGLPDRDPLRVRFLACAEQAEDILLVSLVRGYARWRGIARNPSILIDPKAHSEGTGGCR